MPFPSAGCQTCKIRRIKCDEAKPACQRCMKSRRICIEASAAKEACFMIHVENSYASGRTKRPRGPRSSLTVLRPPLELQARALTHYLQWHLQAPSDVTRIVGGLSNCIYSWKTSGRKCPMVDLALSSMSLAVYSRTQQHPLAATEASSRYHYLLQVAQDRIAHLAVSTLDEREIDACLLAVSLMGRYEGAMHRPTDFNSKNSCTVLHSWSHHDGAKAILKAWNDNLSHKAPTYIIKQTRRGLIKSALLRNLRLPDWMLNGDRFGEHGVELEYDRIVVQIVNLRHACISLQQSNGLEISEAGSLHIEAKELDGALQHWAAQIPSTCSYQRHVLIKAGCWPKDHFYSSIVFSYPKPANAAAWSQYFAMRMLINSTTLTLLHLSSSNSLCDFSYQQQKLECVTQLQAMADSLVSSIPFCLERFAVDDSRSPNRQTSIRLDTKDNIKPYLASLAVWPLSIASIIEGIDARQQLWFREELAKLGKITGNGVLEYAETDQWAIL